MNGYLPCVLKIFLSSLKSTTGVSCLPSGERFYPIAQNYNFFVLVMARAAASQRAMAMSVMLYVHAVRGKKRTSMDLVPCGIWLIQQVESVPQWVGCHGSFWSARHCQP